VRAILRLNEVGRRYLVLDESSISKGVEVLSRVNDDINCGKLRRVDSGSGIFADQPFAEGALYGKHVVDLHIGMFGVKTIGR
jgi:hypothetical protein